MKKTFKLIILMIIALCLMKINVYAADFSVKMETKQEENEVTLNIILDEIDISGAGISVVIFDLKYDRKVFETVATEDITAQNGWGNVTYNPSNGTMLVLREDFTKQPETEIVTVKLHPKTTGKTEIKLTDIQASNAQEDLEAEDQVIKVNLEGTRFEKIIITIVKAIAIIIALLFIIRFFIKSTNKRRKRR